VKSFFILLFSLNLCSGGLLFGEIAKLPALAEHYRLHCQENPETTLTEFLRLHYLDSQHQKDPAHNHHSLPFQHDCGHTAAQLIGPAPAHADYSVVPTVSESLAAANFYYCRYLPAGFVGSLFQPPKA
jgi:hypothetical protein